MTKAELSGLVTEGFALDQEIKERSKRLEEIREVLIGASDGEPCEFAGDECKAVIGFVARIESRLAVEQEESVRGLCGEFFRKLFCFRPVDKFETVAMALLGFENGSALAGMMKGLPGPRVSFKGK